MKRIFIIVVTLSLLPLFLASCAGFPFFGERTPPSETSGEARFAPVADALPEIERGNPPPEKPAPLIQEWPRKIRIDDFSDEPAKAGDKEVKKVVDIGAGPPERVIRPEPEPTSEELLERQLLALLKSAAKKDGGEKLLEVIALMTDGKPDRAFEVLDEIEKDEGDQLLVGVLRTCLNYKLGNTADSLAGLESLVRKVRSEIPLGVPTLKLCRKVQGYAKYEEFAQKVFKPGEKAIIYSEPSHFRCVKDENGYRILLSVRYLMTDSEGNIKWKKEYPIEHITARYLYDLFLLEFLEIPAGVPDGNYKLTIEIQDKQSRYGEKSPAKRTLIFEVRSR